ncbi:hypothetical protein HHK36_010218 [Tetracentron sinense]|uniref:Subtilisin-like protease fibronectin type-III domain-containing protein n=1 Tax=Tetracentron sinense TaxID=13715 RepID=A0A834ZDG2_TETSI|nr:hypothetical protein HHK36_010218 [Tetracentron sinense]
MVLDRRFSGNFVNESYILGCKNFSEEFNGKPSISIPELRKSVEVWRTVINVGPAKSVYTAHVKAPPRVIVRVEPPILSFNSTVKKQKLKAIFCTRESVQGRYSFGSLSWEDGTHVVRIPLVVRTIIDDFYADT